MYLFLNLGDEACAVAKAFLWNAEPVQYGQVYIGQGGALRQDYILATLHCAAGSAHQDFRQRIIVMLVTVAHV